MKICRFPGDPSAALRGGVVTFGNFDGFHRGHCHVLNQTARVADQLSAPLVVMVPEPHPRRYFAPNAPPFRLMSLEGKVRFLERYGADGLVVLPFDASMAAHTAQAFVDEILRDYLACRHVVVGYDNRFGKDRGGDTQFLQQTGPSAGFDVTVVDAFGTDDGVVSSSAIRRALQDGQPREAAEMLGHWWRVDGMVEHGDARGRTIGFPTANVAMGDYIRPALGVYAIRARLQDAPPGPWWDGVANVGKRPTFGEHQVSFEAHLFDFTDDIYDRRLEVELVSFLRPEKKFAGLEALKAQIDADAAAARLALGDAQNRRGQLLPPTRPGH